MRTPSPLYCRLDLAPPLADQFICGVAPSITARYFSSCPSDSTSRWTPCPPKYCKWRLQVRLGCFRLSLSCPFRLLHTFHFLRPATYYRRFWIQRPSSERRRDLNPPDQCAAQRKVHAGRFHRNLLHPMLMKPLRQLLQIARESSECLTFFFGFALRDPDAYTRDYRVAVYVQSSAAAANYGHTVSFRRKPGTPGKIDDFPSRALRLAAEATIRCATHNKRAVSGPHSQSGFMHQTKSGL